MYIAVKTIPAVKCSIPKEKNTKLLSGLHQ